MIDFGSGVGFGVGCLSVFVSVFMLGCWVCMVVDFMVGFLVWWECWFRFLVDLAFHLLWLIVCGWVVLICSW